MAEPHVFVYCGGKKAGEAAPPTSPQGFIASNSVGFGVMWRAPEVTPHLNLELPPVGPDPFMMPVADS